MKNIKTIFNTLLLIFTSTIALAQHNTRVYVSVNGNDSNSEGSINLPFKTINAALNYCLANDSIIIKPGIFKEVININKPLTIASEYVINGDTNYINSTKLDGDFISPNATLITIENGGSLKLVGLTIQNTVGSVIADQSNLGSSLHNLKFLNNGNPGRTMISVNVNSVLEKSLFTGNKGNPIVYLGQVNNSSSNLPTLKSCTFYNNGSPDYLGNSIVYVWNRAYAGNNLMFKNYGAMLNGGCNAPLDTVIFEHNTIVNNIGYGIYLDHCGGGIQGFFSNNIIENNSLGCLTFISNSGGYSVIKLRNNKLDSNPYYSNKPFQYNISWQNNDTISGYTFHYPITDFNKLRLKDTSSLIGNGFANIYYKSLHDFDGNSRPSPIGSNPDIGAFENSLAQPLKNLQNIPNYLPKDKLLGWWPFSGNAIDSSGNGHNGTVRGASLVNDRFGSQASAYQFSPNNFIDVENPTFMVLGKSSFSLSAWFNTTMTGEGNIIRYDCIDSICPSETVVMLRLGRDSTGAINPGVIEYGECCNSVSISSKLKYNDGNWHHVVVVRDSISKSIKMYVDNRLVALKRVNEISNLGIVRPLNFGALQQFYEPFIGKLDDIGIWKKALDSVEIHSIYKPLINTGLINLYDDNSVRIYPNPTSNLIHVNLDDASINRPFIIRVTNIIGQEIHKSVVQQTNSYFDTSEWGANGVYFVNVTDNHTLQNRVYKVIKN